MLIKGRIITKERIQFVTFPWLHKLLATCCTRSHYVRGWPTTRYEGFFRINSPVDTVFASCDFIEVLQLGVKLWLDCDCWRIIQWIHFLPIELRCWLEASWREIIDFLELSLHQE